MAYTLEGVGVDKGVVYLASDARIISILIPEMNPGTAVILTEAGAIRAKLDSTVERIIKLLE